MIKREKQLITSPFGERTHPITGKKKKFHYGVDLRSISHVTWKPQLVIFPETCKVTRISKTSKWGYKIEYQGLDSDYNFVSLHVKPINISVGQIYPKYSIIGQSHITWYMKQHHEHFEVKRKNGINIDPINYFKKYNIAYEYK